MNLNVLSHDLDLIRLYMDANMNKEHISRAIRLMYKQMTNEEMQVMIKYRKTMERLHDYTEAIIRKEMEEMEKQS